MTEEPETEFDWRNGYGESTALSRFMGAEIERTLAKGGVISEPLPRLPGEDGCTFTAPDSFRPQQWWRDQLTTALAERDRARDLAAHLRGEVEAALAFQDDKRGVSCAGYSVDDDGCFVADLAARIRTAIATHDVQTAITGAHLAAHLEAEQAEETK